MWLHFVVGMEVIGQPGRQLQRILLLMQATLLVLDALSEPLNKDIILHMTPAVHADANFSVAAH